MQEDNTKKDPRQIGELPLNLNEILKEPEPENFFQKFFNRVKSFFSAMSEALFGKKKENISTSSVYTAAPPELPKPLTPGFGQSPIMPLSPVTSEIDPFKVPLTKQDIADVKNPTYLYTDNIMKDILEATLDKQNFSVQPAVSLGKEKLPERSQETIDAQKEAFAAYQFNNEKKNVNLPRKAVDLEQLAEYRKYAAYEAQQNSAIYALTNAVNEVKNGKTAAAIPIETGHGHWIGVVVTKDENNQMKFTYTDPQGQALENRGNLKELLQQLEPNAKIEDTNVKQQTNDKDCGPFVTESMIRIANGIPVPTTQEAATMGQALRNDHAQTLERALNKQLAAEVSTSISQPVKSNWATQVSSQSVNNRSDNEIKR